MSATVTTERASKMEFPHPDDEEPYEPSNDPDDKVAEVEEAEILARLRREAKAREIAAEIQHGKTPSKKTAVTQVRILEDQLADLKQIAALTGQNIAGILREVIADYILRMREDEYVRRSLDWAAGGREVMRKMRIEEAAKLAKEKNSQK